MSRYTSRAVRRAPILLVIAGALVVGGLIDRAGAAPPNGAVGVDAVQPVPMVAPAAAFSSSWFCAGATNSPHGPAGGSVVIANSGGGPVSGTVTIVSPKGRKATRTVTVTVGAGSTVSVPETVPGGSAWLGAIVDLDGGSVAVEQVIDGGLGQTMSPCADSGSGKWYFPSGQNRVNASESILLLNPYPDGTIVDLSFTTNEGGEQPGEFQAITVPAGSLVAVPLQSHLRRRSSIATTVSARSGDVVAWEAEIVSTPPSGVPLVGTPAADSSLADPALPDAGLVVTLGAPSAGTSWVWPAGLAGDGVNEQYVIYNPNATATAAIRLSIGLQQGTAEPLDLTVGPGQVVPVVSEQQARIPAGAVHTATLVSTNGVPVVASRTVAAQNATVPGTTDKAAGVGQVLGLRLPADRWMIPAVGADSRHVGQVVVQNPEARPVQATVAGTTVTVPAEGRVSVKITSQSGASRPPLVLSATGPVYVEYDLFGTPGTNGYSLSSAVPYS